MADDPALIWDDEHPIRPPIPRRRSPAAAPADPAPAPAVPGGRITLAEAHHQFGVATSTLGSWARAGDVDAVKDGGRWMVTPASVAARLSSRSGGRRAPTARRADAPGPTADGSAMLVPRDAWDKLMDQLGNLHEAGQMLAEARERAAKAETEAGFLRERLAEMREERDRMRTRTTPAADPRRGLWRRLGDLIRGGGRGPGRDGTD